MPSILSKCNKCPRKDFKRVDDKNDHERHHSPNLYLLFCAFPHPDGTICNRPFTTMNGLQHHVRSAHKPWNFKKLGCDAGPPEIHGVSRKQIYQDMKTDKLIEEFNKKHNKNVCFHKVRFDGCVKMKKNGEMYFEDDKECWQVKYICKTEPDFKAMGVKVVKLSEWLEMEGAGLFVRWAQNKLDGSPWVTFEEIGLEFMEDAIHFIVRYLANQGIELQIDTDIDTSFDKADSLDGSKNSLTEEQVERLCFDARRRGETVENDLVQQFLTPDDEEEEGESVESVDDLDKIWDRRDDSEEKEQEEEKEETREEKKKRICEEIYADRVKDYKLLLFYKIISLKYIFFHLK